ncbi:hypothetical protein RCL_jg13850.t1 [Rhizophagus clarus]|uniref:Uncharacterized protein n=1 Tax=Rhizophagus clarus TaxID=94130 RepID=A0A8H3LUN1_9GLOM|nr:hypothetical protein RCL_jg13850.t1 [Rhizophagus clarus]
MNTLNRTTFYVNTKILNTLGYCSYHKFMQWINSWCVDSLKKLDFTRYILQSAHSNQCTSVLCCGRTSFWQFLVDSKKPYSKKRNHIIS